MDPGRAAFTRSCRRRNISRTSAYATDTEISPQEISWGKNKYCWRHRNSTLPGWYISSVTTIHACGESIIRMASWSFLLISHVGMEPKDHSAIRSRQITALYPRLSTNQSSHRVLEKVESVKSRCFVCNQDLSCPAWVFLVSNNAR